MILGAFCYPRVASGFVADLLDAHWTFSLFKAEAGGQALPLQAVKDQGYHELFVKLKWAFSVLVQLAVASCFEQDVVTQDSERPPNRGLNAACSLRWFLHLSSPFQFTTKLCLGHT